MKTNAKNVCRISPVHISTIKVGDIILEDGKLCTIGKGDLQYKRYGMGYTLRGDSYHLGYKPVIRVTNLKFYDEDKLKFEL